jgi:uncharacterized FlaG/YvyC family protein
MPEGKMYGENVTPISNIELERPAAVQVQAQQVAQVKAAQPVKQAEPAAEEKKVVEAKSTPVKTSDVQLRFIVDGETNNITVLVVDRTNQRVIRSIPPEELNQFQKGDLLSLFA